MKYFKAVGCVVILSAALIGNANAASSTFTGVLDLSNYEYQVPFNGTDFPAAADFVRFDLGTGLMGDAEIILQTGPFSAFAMLGISVATDPNDALYNDPSPFLQLTTSTDVRGFFDDNVTGWEFYAYGNDYVASDTTNNINTFGLQFDPLEHYYAFVAGGALQVIPGSNEGEIALSLTVNDASNGPSPVPLPAAVWLFGTGIAGFIGIGRRKKAFA